jgi:hypothetical protein
MKRNVTFKKQFSVLSCQFSVKPVVILSGGEAGAEGLTTVALPTLPAGQYRLTAISHPSATSFESALVRSLTRL